MNKIEKSTIETSQCQWLTMGQGDVKIIFIAIKAVHNRVAKCKGGVTQHLGLVVFYIIYLGWKKFRQWHAPSK